MIIVRVELHSAVTGAVTELARMKISNDGSGTAGIGNYDCVTWRGRDQAALDRREIQRRARVEHYPRRDLHVWHLVAAALYRLKYRS